MITQNTFTDGLIKDLNPLTTPNNVLTDALNATIITYNGEEFVLQNDMGNCKVERAKLPPGFIPLGMQEYGGIVYVTSLNPETGEHEVGSFPSPERDFNTKDFENLAPVKFQTSQFRVATTDPNVVENTIMVGKLFEPELFMLHPGDKYVVTYKINPVAGGPAPDVIDSETKMLNYISTNPLDRKLFKLNFFKITDSNNLIELENGSIKVVSSEADIEAEYVFFKENSASTIAIGLKLEDLDYFDSNIINISSRLSDTKKVAVEAVGFSDSLEDFKGIRIDITEPEVATYFVDKIGSGRKVSAIIDQLPSNSKLKASITPYSKYNLFTQWKKDYELDLGQFETFDDINTTYRFLYRDGVSNNDGYMIVDFDYRSQGESGNGLDIYMEFYDIQEDYSLLQKIDNPSFYGNMKVQIELEAKNITPYRDPNNPNLTNPTLLTTNPDTTYLRSVLSQSNRIRTDAKLKRNYFYIVRISGIDRVPNGSPQGFEYKHYDLYKGIYTHDMFNTEYNNNPEIKDFNTLDFKKDTVKYTGIVSNVSISGEEDSKFDDSIYKTGENYYRIIKDGDPNPIPADNKYRGGYTITKSKSDNLSFSLTGFNKYFGTFKSELVQLQPPVSVPDSSYQSLITGGYVPIEQPYDKVWIDPTMKPDFSSTWNINRLTPTQFNVVSTVSTTRKVLANLRKQSNYNLTGTSKIKPTRLLKWGRTPFAVGPQSWDYGDSRSVVHWDRRNHENSPLKYVRDNGSIDSSALEWKDYNNGEQLADIINRNEGVKWSAFLASSADSSVFDPGAINGSYGFDAMDTRGNSRDEFPFPGANGTNWKANFLIIRTNSGAAADIGKFVLALSADNPNTSHVFEDIIEFFDNLAIISKYSGKGTIYSVSDSEVIINSQSTGVVSTVVSYPQLPFTSITALENNAKTYLSKVYMKALNQTVDFKTDTVNSYIASRQLPDTLTNTIKDGFIPFITQPNIAVEYIQLPNISVLGTVGGRINQLISKLVADKDKWQDDPLIFDNAGGANHGDVVYIEAKNKFQPESWVRTNFKAKGTIGNPATSELPNANGIYFEFNAPNQTDIWYRRKDSGNRSATDKWNNKFKQWIYDTHNFNYMRG